jgi:hypothetical protein
VQTSHHVRQTPATIATEWVRSPRPRERVEGLSRSELYVLADSGQIRTKAIRKPGCTRGIRLFSVSSIRSYIENAPEEAAK